MSELLPITGIVVVRNEQDLLPACLASLAECCEVIVIDLSSSDGSAETAQRLGARVVTRSPSPIVEHVRQEALGYANTDWVLFLDPDERVTSALWGEIRNLLRDGSDNAAVVRLPFQYFAKDKPLRGTPWGGTQYIARLFNGRRVHPISGQVHSVLRPLPGYQELTAARLSSDGVIEHYWFRSWRDLIARHRRYLQYEGRRRYESGYTCSFVWLLLAPILYFVHSFIVRRGFREGVTGLALSVLWAWYNTSSLRELRRFRRSLQR